MLSVMVGGVVDESVARMVEPEGIPVPVIVWPTASPVREVTVIVALALETMAPATEAEGLVTSAAGVAAPSSAKGLTEEFAPLKRYSPWKVEFPASMEDLISWLSSTA